MVHCLCNCVQADFDICTSTWAVGHVGSFLTAHQHNVGHSLLYIIKSPIEFEGQRSRSQDWIFGYFNIARYAHAAQLSRPRLGISQ